MGLQIHNQLNFRFLNDFSKVRHSPGRWFLASWLFHTFLVGSLIFFAGPSTSHNTFNLSMSTDQLIEVLGFSDAGVYLREAQSFLVSHSLKDSSALNLWAPGMIWFDALILKLSPIGFAKTVGITLAVLWGAVFALVTWPFVTGWRSFIVFLPLELLILGTSPFQQWMFDEGIFYAEGIASALLVAGLALLILRVRSGGGAAKWFRDGAFAGVLIAGAVYFRAALQLVPFAMLTVTIITCIVALIDKQHFKQLIKHSLAAGTSFLVVLILLAPYIFFLKETRGRTELVTADYFYNLIWKNPAKEEVPSWLSSAGATVACDIDQLRCAEIEKRRSSGEQIGSDFLRDEFVAAVLSHPVEYLSQRFHFAAQQFIGDDYDSYFVARLNQNPAQGWFYLFMLLSTIVVAIDLSRKRYVLLTMIPAVSATLIAPFALSHMEVRYFIPLKMITVLFPLLISVYYGRQEIKSTSSICVK